MGKKGLLLCVCQGTCPSFKGMDIFEVLNSLRRENLFDFVGIHPQLCADDGDEFLKALLSGKKVDKLYVAGCDPKMQIKMFKQTFEDLKFNPANHFAADIRNMDTQQAIAKIKEMVK